MGYKVGDLVYVNVNEIIYKEVGDTTNRIFWLHRRFASRNWRRNNNLHIILMLIIALIFFLPVYLYYSAKFKNKIGRICHYWHVPNIYTIEWSYKNRVREYKIYDKKEIKLWQENQN